MKCPKCDLQNQDSQQFCGHCGSSLSPQGEFSPSMTKTIETPREELTTGSLFAGRFQIIDELGKGGMGRVYRVLDKKLSEEVALKLIKPDLSKDKKTVERFSNELKLSRKIVHRNIARMFDLNEDKGTHYIIMEYVRGEDLKRLIRKIGQLGVAQAIPIAKQICEGLAEAHRSGVVHRDLKPQNVMVDEDGNARIMDFGIARSLESQGITGSGVMIGTPEYMSPEQVEGKDIDQRSDIYSLGVVLYEMLTGRVPFEGATPFAVGMKHKGELPKDPGELNAQIPRELRQMILRCLAKDREKRYRNAEELRKELANLEKGFPTAERILPKRKPLTSKEITIQFSLRKFFLPASIVGALVIAAMLVIWKPWTQKKTVFAPRIENSIAVISFENQTGEESYAYLQKAIPNLLITNLERKGGLYVATWERMQDLMEQLGRKNVEVIDSKLGFELCQREGIEAIVLGSYIKAGDTFATNIKVLDVNTKKLLRSSSATGEGISSILKTQIDDLTRDILEGIDLASEDIYSSEIHMTDITTNSMEAYKYYLEGKENLRKLYVEDAHRSFEKAVELDPDFAMAHYYLSHADRNYDVIEESIRKANALSHKTTERERLYIEARYAHLIEEDQEKQIKIFHRIAEKFPKEKEIHHILGNYYTNERLFDIAIEKYNDLLKLDPNSGEAYNGLGYTYLFMGDLLKAVDYFNKYVALNPGEVNPISSLAEAYFQLGKLDEALANFEDALAIKPDFQLNYFAIGYIHALREEHSEAMRWIDDYIETTPPLEPRRSEYLFKAFYLYWLGRVSESLSYLDKAVEEAEKKGQTARPYINWLKAFIAYDRGELDLSRQHLKIWFDIYTDFPTPDKAYFRCWHNFLSGLIDLKEGHLDSARTMLTEMKSFLPDLPAWGQDRVSFYIDFLSAELLIQEGFPEKAIIAYDGRPPLRPPELLDVLMTTYNLPFSKDILPRAHELNGDLDEAIKAYESLITFNPDDLSRELIHPKYHYRIAMLYEQKGWNGKAIDSYNKFLGLWKNADRGLSEVVDAKKRLTGLSK